MELLFGRKKTPAELLRQHQRALQKAQREMDREKAKLDIAEKKLIADIKKSAKANQMSACKIMAKDLVRTRRYSQKFQAMKTQLQAVSLRIQLVDTPSSIERETTKEKVPQIINMESNDDAALQARLDNLRRE
ncbi:7095_t:CDS:2 [Dentiscutata erythropus]|uniref:7095_t:CDS:1 n=1 Tax=Dentiscutata erythropus TaxID=1348616 RepID=A0A9N9DJV2_9GLOM|nr:7095_t:CDS:2 [Dentiscutata erythropus]